MIIPSVCCRIDACVATFRTYKPGHFCNLRHFYYAQNGYLLEENIPFFTGFVTVHSKTVASSVPLFLVRCFFFYLSRPIFQVQPNFTIAISWSKTIFALHQTVSLMFLIFAMNIYIYIFAEGNSELSFSYLVKVNLDI